MQVYSHQTTVGYASIVLLYHYRDSFVLAPILLQCKLVMVGQVSETIRTKGTNGLAVQCVHCERLGYSVIMTDFVLMNACMQG